MDLRRENQRIIASNMANLDTPGYTAQRLDFQASMENAVRGMQEPAVIEPAPEAGNTLDGNNVNLENELSNMSQNRVLYSLSALIMGDKFRQISNLLDQDQNS
jgi:flagellar basal-body rod protein FlgB